MNIIETKYIDIGDDPDRGELLIGDGLVRNKHLLPDYSYVHMLLSPLINNHGIINTQNVVDDIVKNNKETKLIFVCQHIYVDYINFGEGNVVFSTHCNKNNNDVLPIPHYSITYEEDHIKDEKGRMFSFIGHCGTHKIREDLLKLYPEHCFSTDNVWMSKKHRNQYLDMMGRSKFSLTPRGTGISSIRLFESLKMGSVPVIISDDIELPFSDKWKEFSVTIKEDELDTIEEVLSKFNDSKIKEMSKKGQEFWEEYCSDENLYKTIIMTLK